MDGLESVVRDCIERTMRSPWSYLEIGVAYGGTLKGVWEYVKDRSPDMLVVGVDKVGGWSLDLGHIRRKFPQAVISTGTQIDEGKPNILLCGVDVLMQQWNRKLSLCLVDGCHSTRCCAKDFMLVEPHIEPGGIVMFHDAGQDQEGGSLQPCCGVGIGVFTALKNLGLLDGTRPGWSKCDLVKGKTATMGIVSAIG